MNAPNARIDICTFGANYLSKFAYIILAFQIIITQT